MVKPKIDILLEEGNNLRKPLKKVTIYMVQDKNLTLLKIILS